MSYTPPPCNAVQNIPPCVPFSHSTRRPRVESRARRLPSRRGLAGALPCCLWRAPVRQHRMPRAMEDAESAEVAEAAAGAEG